MSVKIGGNIHRKCALVIQFIVFAAAIYCSVANSTISWPHTGMDYFAESLFDARF